MAWNPLSAPPNVNPQMSLGMGQMPMQGPPSFLLPDPAPPSQKFQDDAKEWYGRFGKRSKMYQDSRWPDIEKYLELLKGQLSLFDWKKNRLGTTITSDGTKINLAGILGDKANELGLSDYVHPIAPAVLAMAESIYLQIFSGPEWFRVTCEDEEGGPTGDEQIPTEYKVQQIVGRKLKQGRLHGRVFLALVHAIATGQVAAKLSWHTHRIRRRKWDMQTLSPVSMMEVAFQAPIIAPIRFTDFLPDPDAQHGDVNLWRGVGNTVLRTYAEIKAQFTRGVYSLNEKEFDRLFKEKESDASQEYTPSGMTQGVDEDVQGMIRVWEMHGRVPSENELVECSCTLLTDPNITDPSDGVMVRLTTEPLLWSGFRPYAYWQYSPQDEPCGQGMIAQNEDSHFQLSQFTAQLQDVARRTAITSWQGIPGSAGYEWAKKNGGIKNGSMVDVDVPDKDISPIKFQPAPTADMTRMVSQLLTNFERGTVTETFLGVSSADDTATGSTIRQQQSQMPSNVRADLFARNFMEPALNIALGMLQQYQLTDETIKIRDYGGNWRPITITPEELQRGKYTIEVTLTNQDLTSAATLQALHGLLQDAVNLQPLFMQEGVRLNVGEIAKRIVDCARIDGADRIVTVMGTREQMLLQQNQALQQQLAMLQGGQPGQGGPPQGPQPGPGPEGGGIPPIMEDGGPMGGSMDDMNAAAQQAQFEAQAREGWN